MNAGAPDMSATLRFLLDTNAFISLEPFDGAIEPNQRAVANIIRLASKQQHRVFVHPASRDELSEGSNKIRSTQRVAELDKFDMLQETPVPVALETRAGKSVSGTNDHRDLRLLAALNGKAVHYLVSNDERLRRRAARCGLAASVLTAADAEALLLDFEPSVRQPPPKVETPPAYALDIDQEIFDSLRQDYDGEFDQWLAKVRLDSDNRECHVITEDDGSYSAFAILKPHEQDCEYDLSKPVTKISTFKVADTRAGNRYGELLLKSILSSHSYHGSASAYVEIFEKHDRLIALLENFGYYDTNARTKRGEMVVAKQLKPAGTTRLSPLDYHVQYGPPALAPDTEFFIIPIVPPWHRQLFPDDPGQRSDDPQISLLPDLDRSSLHPWGNALRKAYLCHSPSKQLVPGSGLLFYRSDDWKSVSAIGVVEETIRSSDPDEILKMVGGRTVYTRENIADQCRKNPVLVILFRQDRFIEPAWGITELLGANVVKSAPRSITKISKGGNKWIHTQLTE